MTTDKEWADEEKSKIELLKKKLSPSNQIKFGKEIAEIEAMLDLYNETGMDIPKEEKKRAEKQITSLVSGLRSSTLGSKPTMEEVPEMAAKRAKLIKASTFMSDVQDTDKGIQMAKDYIANDPKDTTADGFETPDTRDFEIDEDLTRMTGPAGQERGAVFTNPKTKQLEIVFRGTKFRADKNVEPYEGFNPLKRLRNVAPIPDAHTAEDLQLDYDIVVGGRNWNPLSSSRNLDAEIRHPQFDTAKRVVEAAKAKYPEFEPHISGYSLGGNTGIITGNATNTNTTTFNPHTLGRNILSGSTHPRNVKHNIIRTNKDIPSILSGAHKVEYPDNYQVDVIPVHSTNSREFSVRNPRTYTGLNDAHRLNNFYLRSGGKESVERQRQISDEGSRYLDALNKGASMRKLDDIIEFHNNFMNDGGANADADEFERAEQSRRRGEERQPSSRRETARGRLRQIPEQSTTPELDAQLADIEEFTANIPEIPQTNVKPKAELKQLRDKLDTLNAELGDETPEQAGREFQAELDASKGTSQEARVRQSGMKRRQQHAERQSIKEELGLLPKQETRTFQQRRPTSRGSLRRPPPELYEPISRVQERPPRMADIPDLASQMREVGEEVPARLGSIPEERQGEGWFSKYARQKGLSTDDHNKHLYKKALDFSDQIPSTQKNQLKLSDKENAGYDEDFARQVTGVDDNFIQDYVQASPSIRDAMKSTNDTLIDTYKNGFDNVGNHEVAGVGNRLSNATKSFGESFGEAGSEALSAKGVGGAIGGLALGALIHKGWSKYVDPDKKLDKVVYHGDDMAESALGGAILGKAMGQGFGMGGLVGLGSTAVGLGVEEGSDWALEKMGVKKNVSEGIGSGLGGAAAGATAVGLGLLGAEEGATAGSFAGPAGMAVGALVGAGIGVASHYLGKYIKWPF